MKICIPFIFFAIKLVLKVFASFTSQRTSEVTMTDSETPSRDFLLGVVEGFYGRPFTSEQRKELFRKIKNFGMQCYVYAPKDDYKHRGYWRELYTVEEGDHLAGKTRQQT